MPMNAGLEITVGAVGAAVSVSGSSGACNEIMA